MTSTQDSGSLLLGARPAATFHTATRSSLEVRPRSEIPPEQLPPLLRHGPVRIADLEDAAEGDVEAILAFHAQLHSFADAQLVTFAAGSAPGCLAELRPMAPGFRLAPVPRRRIALSRFAHLRADAATLVLETPLGVGAMRILHPAALAALSDLASGADAATLIGGAERPADMYAFIELLLSNAAAGLASEGGAAQQDETPVLQHWEFHDLLFHGRSRLGRHDGQMGATFRFLDRLEPTQCLPDRSFPTTISFPPPSRPPPLDSDLVSLLGRRASVREQSQVPITIRELGEFLYHSARVIDVVPGPQGPFTMRPYPSGGASYELETYLVVDKCLGLTPGFYYYDGHEHGLASIGPPNADTEALLDNAYIASGQSCRPQVLLAFASRFQRVSWKYAGIAYATTLKNVGALYATMYLVATAMGLAPCALGVGDSERFSRLAGTDRYTEATVGEFMIGSGA
jgi:SagB-type dehydrogenase family enzyme